MRLIWYELCTELIAGQRADLTGAAAGRRDRAHAERVARLKSGCYTIERPLELGASAAHAGPAVRDALLEAGRHIGQAFALRDDLLGIWGDPGLTGKPAGDDLAEAKATVILALAHERLTGTDAARLDRLGPPQARPAAVAALADALVASGVRDEVEHLVAASFDQARAALARAPLAPAGVEGLTRTARSVAWRDS